MKVSLLKSARWNERRSTSQLKLKIAATLLASAASLPLYSLAASDEAATVPLKNIPVAKSISETSRDIKAGKTTAVAQVQAYLARIEALDKRGPKLQSVLAINPDALKAAQELDKEFKSKGPRGPLHGVPILIKDNIESIEPLPTTAGSLALINNVTKRDAPIVANLRAAGAVILGKTNLSEWANFRSDHSISGWSGLGGFTKNPYVLDRSPCGSSAGSGTATAAGLAAGSVGTETDGSITCPSSMNGLVGLKPTLGLLSGSRIVPIAHSQDTAGPMTTTVTDAALLLTAMVGESPACTAQAIGCKKVDYAAALSTSALQGKRVGVWRFPKDRLPTLDPIYENALEVLRSSGATLIEVPVPDANAIYEAEGIVLNTEFKVDLNAYLATTPAAVKSRTLAQLIEFNKNTPRELSLFGQERFIEAETTKGLDDPAYKIALEASKRLAGPEGIAKTLAENKLDFVVAPTAGSTWRIDIANGDQFPGSFSTLPAVSGYPHLTVPMGAVRGLPVGLSFIGSPLSEATLLAAGFAYEQKANARIAPTFKASLESKEPALDKP